MTKTYEIKEVTKPQFETPDGVKHPSLAAAQAHMDYQEHKALIESFLNHIEAQPAQAGHLRKVLPQFMRYQADFTPPEAAGNDGNQPAEAGA